MSDIDISIVIPLMGDSIELSFKVCYGKIKK